MKTVEKVLHPYGEQYFDSNVRHFPEKLRDEHGIELGYGWMKHCGADRRVRQQAQEAGLASQAAAARLLDQVVSAPVGKSANKLLTGDPGTFDIIQNMETVCD
jgi:hypothetical protein